ncbi:hypothetical protein MMC10_002799 [Thelotrema lepadinum]|nr:hypothetical protein [Thelotrema lepadinum]
MPSKVNFRLSITGKTNAIIIILATIFLPCSYVTYYLRATNTVEAAAETKLLLDPGPRHRCYRYEDLGRNYSYSSRAPECEAVQGYSGCPTWRYSSYKSDQNHTDLLLNRSGSLIDVALVNNAHHVNQEPSEVSLDYYYPGCSIQKLSNRTQFNLLEYDQWVFEYDVTLRMDNHTALYMNATNSTTLHSRYGPRQTRRYLRTEFVYQHPNPACASVNNPSAGRGGIATSNTTATNTTCPPLESTIAVTHLDTALTNTTFQSNILGSTSKSRVMHLLSSITFNPNTTTHISLDFKSLYQNISTTPCNQSINSSTQPAWLNAHMIRVVSGALGIDSVVEVGNVSAVLRKGNS